MIFTHETFSKYRVFFRQTSKTANSTRTLLPSSCSLAVTETKETKPRKVADVYKYSIKLCGNNGDKDAIIQTKLEGEGYKPDFKSCGTFANSSIVGGGNFFFFQKLLRRFF